MAEHLDTLANCMDLQRLAKNLHTCSGRKAFNRCLKFLIQDHGTTSAKVVELLLKVEQLNLNPTITIDDEVLDEIDQLEAHLVHFLLYERPLEMLVVDNGMETEVNKATENEDMNARIEVIVELLPLNQYLKTTAEHYALCGILEKMVTGVVENYDRELSCLPDFATGSGLANPKQQMLLQHLSKILHDQPVLAPLISQAYQKFTQNAIWQAANLQVDFWLSWRSEVAEEEEHGLWFKGRSLLYSPLLSHCLFKLLATEENGQSITSKMADKSIATISLGKFQEKNDQLVRIKSLLWQCSGMMASGARQQRSVDLKSLSLHLCHLLRALSSYVKEEADERYHQLLDTIAAIQPLSDQRRLRSLSESLDDIFHFEGEAHTIEFDMRIRSKLPRQCLRLMSKCFELVLRMSSEKKECLIESMNLPDHLVEALQRGSGFVVLGTLQTLLLSPCGPVDPAEKEKVKLAHLSKEALDIERELRVRGLQLQLLTGKTLEDCEIAMHPPRVRFLFQRLTVVQKLMKELAQNTAARPERSQFSDLIQEINHYKSSIGSQQMIEGLYCDLQTSFYESDTTSDFSDVLSLLRRGRAWLHSQHQFITKLQDCYPLYRDLIQPFMGGGSHLIYGMQLMVESVERLHRHRSLMINSSVDIGCLESVLQSLACFPMPNSLYPTSGSRAEFMCKEATMQTVLGLAREKNAQQPAEPQIDYKKRLLRIILLHLKNHALLSSYLLPSIIELLAAIFSTFVKSWLDAQEAAKIVAEEEASLFRFKARVHCEEATDEEQDEMEMRRSFPLFDQDFADLIVQPTLESQSKEPASTDPKSSTNDDDHGSLSQLEMYQLTTIHKDVFSQLTGSHWLRASCSTIESADYFEVFRHGYQLSACLYDGSMDLLDSNIDAKLFGSHLLQNGLVLAQIHPEASTEHVTKPGTKPFDIYHDPCVSEVAQCRPILEKLTVRINELLEDWPEHPILKQMILVMKRILSFPVTSSLMKFASGLELLLEKAQEWERNASKAVSLQDHLESVTRMIIQWRKLELKSWESCLENVTYKAAEMSAKWWFQLYQLIQSFLSPNLDNLSPSAAEQEIPKPSGIQELVKALQQFMEAATIGDFESRLSMVFAFHCQIVHHPSSDNRVEIMNVLWNVYKFYRQFLLAVQTEVQKQKKSIEKELKDFVKIAKWNDINFWAMKEAVAKTHKTLHKFSKKFQQALNAPARSAFSDENIPKEMPAADVEIVPMTTHTNYISPESVKVYFDHIYEDQIHTDDQPSLQSRLPSLFVRMTKLCRCIFRRSPFARLTTSLDGFTTAVVATMHDLQALDVTKHEDKEKQKSEAKHINLRKRKALAMLFKEFTRAGLSYRKGLALSEQEETDAAMEISAVDLAVALNNEKASEDTVRLWQGCEYYFYRSIARKATFFSAMDTPSKELGIGNIERCRGFSEHISSLVVKQRQEIAEVTEDFDHLRHLFEQLQRINSQAGSGSDLCLPNQIIISHRILSLQNLLCQAGETLLQTVMLLECCPRMVGDEETSLIPFPVEQLSAMSRAKKGDYTWARTMTSLKQFQERVDSMKQVINPIAMKLHRSDSKYVLTWSDVQILQNTVSGIKSLSSELSDVEDAFAAPDLQEKSSMLSSLSCLRNAIDCFEEELLPVKNTDSSQLREVSSSCSAFQRSVEALLNRVLLSVQNLQKMDTSNIRNIEEDSRSNDGKSEEDAEDEHAAELIESHIKLLTNGLSESKQWTDSKNIKMALKTIITDLIDMHTDSPRGETNKSELNNSVAILLRMVPILHQYLQLVTFHLHQMVSAHRTTSKLLSILLGVFTELATKGFCIPPEFSDEIGEGGATEFEDIEGGGIGAGEGVKDVSDQIENEDQVQDTKKPGDDDEENDANNQPDLEDEEHGIEMSEDFEGKLHDVEKQAVNESGNESEGDDENQLDKQMGDLGNEETDKLDERMWGDDEDEEDEEKDKEKKDEYGDGAGEEQQSQLVAKDDNQGDESGDKEQNKGTNEENKDENEEKESPKPNNLEPMDEEEYNDDVDPKQANDPPPEVVPEDFDLPDDLDLDQMKDGDEDDEEKEGEDAEENPLDIEPEISDNKNLDKMEEVEDEEKMEDDGEEDGGEENKDNENNDRQEDEEMKDVEEQEGPDDVGKSAEPQENDEEPLAQDDPTSESVPDQSHNSEQMPEAAEQLGKSHEETDQVNKDKGGDDETGKSEEKEKEEEHGTGSSQAEQSEGHDGDKLSEVTRQDSQDRRDRHRKRPSQSDSDRTLGSAEEKMHKRLKTIDESKDERQTNNDDKQSDEADLYEHVQETSSHDVQTLDAATNEQQAEQPALNADSDDSDVDDMETDDNVLPHEDNEQETEKMDTLPPSKLKTSKQDGTDKEKNAEPPGLDDVKEDVKENIKEERSETFTSAQSTYHTAFDLLETTDMQPLNPEDIEGLRRELEEQLVVVMQNKGTIEEEKHAQEAWHKYVSLTSSLARDLCEQLRLVLEPTQASKLRGDFRSGKRLNMRKVIPYIASHFRKDKIWLRRSKPSKRQYQIMLAVDDSSSMDDNHSKQLAFESLAVISNALTWLEVGEFSVCSFGESVQLLHPFHEQFTDQSGGRILQQFTFSQKKTKIGQLLKYISSLMTSAQYRLRGIASSTSQLLLVVSDGRGLFLEGMETVRSAVRQARDANIFLVFVILDNPKNKDSILDIRVPLFKGPGELPEIRSYMEHFPFPFYIVLRDISALPETLSDALRQWFELVTAGE